MSSFDRAVCCLREEQKERRRHVSLMAISFSASLCMLSRRTHLTDRACRSSIRRLHDGWVDAMVDNGWVDEKVDGKNREVACTVRAVCLCNKCQLICLCVAVVFEEFWLLSPEILCALSRRFSVS